jgi:hypothetical protein
MDGITALDTLKSFKTLLSEEDFTEFVKGTDSEKLRAFSEVQEFLKGFDKEFIKEKEDGKDDEEDKEKEDKEEHEAGESKEKEDKEEKAEKAVTPEMLKGLQDEMNTKFKGVTEILKGFGNDDKIAELQKSVDAVTSLVEKIAGMPLGTKAIKAGAAANFFEKSFGGEQEDESGKKVLSVTMNKEQILKSLEDGMNKAVDPELKRSYEDSIVRYNAGGGTIAQPVAMDLFENFNIRITK